MARAAHEGATYIIDRRDGRPSHWWIVLNDPDRAGKFIAISLTDRRHVPASSDLWPAGWNLTDDWSLKKDSVLFLRFATVKTQTWLDSFDAQYQGKATVESIWRARCNLCWHIDQIQPEVWPVFQSFESEWCPDCFD